MTRERTRFAGAAVVALTAAVMTLGPALPAAAHNYVVSSTPADGETLTEVPEFFVITTNEPMLDLTGERAGFALQVTDSSGLYYGDGCVDIAGASMATRGALGAAGDYTLTYQYISADGHTLSDTLAFRYEPADESNAQSGRDAPPTCGAAGEPGASGDPSATPVDENAAVLGLVGGVLGAIVLLVIIAVVIARTRGSRERAAEHDGSVVGSDGPSDGGGGGGD